MGCHKQSIFNYYFYGWETLLRGHDKMSQEQGKGQAEAVLAGLALTCTVYLRGSCWDEVRMLNADKSGRLACKVRRVNVIFKEKRSAR